MAFWDKKKGGKKGPRKDPADREKRAGAREYEAKRQDRIAERLEAEGDAEGAKTAREAAAAEREPRSRQSG